jgi:hypothetical protein
MLLLHGLAQGGQTLGNGEQGSHALSSAVCGYSGVRMGLTSEFMPGQPCVFACLNGDAKKAIRGSPFCYSTLRA